VSKASANQRKGRAGRTQPGTTYRLYTRKDFENRLLITPEEIYRTDLSEVVLRMADLGLTAFEEFDFIAPPNREGLIAAIETLNLLNALETDRTLSKIGKLMTEFPLPPRQSRIIVEAILHYPQIIQETLIAAAFLSTQSPYILPPGEETDARKAHHRFRDAGGDFVSYLKLYNAYQEARNKVQFCEKNYLDERAMKEIVNVTAQLGEIVSSLDIPIPSHPQGFSTEDYLCAVARGLIQFVCVREGRDMYRSLTADRILIHPGSVMFKMDPEYIVAGEIVRTTRMYAMSVSPLSRKALEKISDTLFERLGARNSRSATAESSACVPPKRVRDFTQAIKIGDEVFDIGTVKGKKLVSLPWERLSRIKSHLGTDSLGLYKNLRGKITLEGGYTLLEGEKLDLILALATSLDLEGVREKQWPRKERFHFPENLQALLAFLPDLVSPALWKAHKKEVGFICLLNDGAGTYWFTCSRGFHTGLNESLASLEALIDDLGEYADGEVKRVVNQTYRKLSDYLG
jgi:HrpA-like RNA helicase